MMQDNITAVLNKYANLILKQKRRHSIRSKRFLNVRITGRLCG
jgi:hypothetical protein